MKFALIALLAISFTGCTDTLYNHHKDFSPNPGRGPWTDKYHDRQDGQQDDDSGRRPLFPKREPSTR